MKRYQSDLEKFEVLELNTVGIVRYILRLLTGGNSEALLKQTYSRLSKEETVRLCENSSFLDHAAERLRQMEPEERAEPIMAMLDSAFRNQVPSSWTHSASTQELIRYITRPKAMSDHEQDLKFLEDFASEREHDGTNINNRDVETYDDIPPLSRNDVPYGPTLYAGDLRYEVLSSIVAALPFEQRWKMHWPGSIRFAYERSIRACLEYALQTRSAGRKCAIRFSGLEDDRTLVAAISKFLGLRIKVDRDVPWVRLDAEEVQTELVMPPAPFELESLAPYVQREIIQASKDPKTIRGKIDLESMALEDAQMAVTRESIVAVGDPVLGQMAIEYVAMRRALQEVGRLHEIVRLPAGVLHHADLKATNLLRFTGANTQVSRVTYADVGQSQPARTPRDQERTAFPEWSVMGTERDGVRARRLKTINISYDEIDKGGGILAAHRHLALLNSGDDLFSEFGGRILLTDLFQMIRGGPPESSAISQSEEARTAKVIRPSDIDQHGHLDLADCQEINYPVAEFRRRVRKRLLQEGDILLVRTGPVGRVAIVTQDDTKWHLITNQQFVILRAKEIGESQSLDPIALFTLLFSEAARKALEKLVVQSTSKSMTQSTLENLWIEVPDRDAQQKVVEIREEMTSILREIDNLRHQVKLKEDEAVFEFRRTPPDSDDRGAWGIERSKTSFGQF